MQKLQTRLSITIVFLIFALTNTFSQEETPFSPNGKPIVLIFTNINTSFNQEGSSRSIELSRAYLGYEYFFSKTLSSRINIDIGDPGVGKLQMTAFIKNAYLLYKNSGFSARFGMIGTDQYSLLEKQWGYRYVYKSFQDAYNFGPSADLGAAMEYSPAEFISLDVSVLNGEGYKKIQSDSTFKETLGITIKPFKGFAIRGYFDMMNHNYNQTSLSLYAGYTYKFFKAGMEYNSQKNNGNINQHDFSGISLYASFMTGKKFTVFSRYDKLESSIPAGDSTPWNSSKDGQLFMVGFDYLPVKGVKIAPTYSGWSPYDKSMPYSSTLALNFEIKF
jgi:hypothetical protein